MRNLLRAFGMVAALTLVGCDGASDEHVEFKPTDTKQFEEMKNQMIGNMKNKSYTKNPKAAAGETGAAPAEKAQ